MTGLGALKGPGLSDVIQSAGWPGSPSALRLCRCGAECVVLLSMSSFCSCSVSAAASRPATAFSLREECKVSSVSDCTSHKILALWAAFGKNCLFEGGAAGAAWAGEWPHKQRACCRTLDALTHLHVKAEPREWLSNMASRSVGIVGVGSSSCMSS